MKVFDVMTSSVVTVTPKSSFKTLWTTVFSNRINALPVVDHKKKLLGIIAKEDLLKPLYPDYKELLDDLVDGENFDLMEEKMKDVLHITAGDLMSKKVIFTRDNTPAMRALSRMLSQSVDQLPVVDEDDTVIGMITRGDVFSALFKKYLKRIHKKKQKK